MDGGEAAGVGAGHEAHVEAGIVDGEHEIGPPRREFAHHGGHHAAEEADVARDVPQADHGRLVRVEEEFRAPGPHGVAAHAAEFDRAGVPPPQRRHQRRGVHVARHFARDDQNAQGG